MGFSNIITNFAKDETKEITKTGNYDKGLCNGDMSRLHRSEGAGEGRQQI